MADRTPPPVPPAALAQLFHETYERLAPDFGYRTREASAKPWPEVPEQNKALMTAVCAEILSNPILLAAGRKQAAADIRSWIKSYDDPTSTDAEREVAHGLRLAAKIAEEPNHAD